MRQVFRYHWTKNNPEGRDKPSGLACVTGCGGNVVRDAAGKWVRPRSLCPAHIGEHAKVLQARDAGVAVDELEGPENKVGPKVLLKLDEADAVSEQEAMAKERKAQKKAAKRKAKEEAETAARKQARKEAKKERKEARRRAKEQQLADEEQARKKPV